MAFEPWKKKAEGDTGEKASSLFEITRASAIRRRFLVSSSCFSRGESPTTSFRSRPRARPAQDVFKPIDYLTVHQDMNIRATIFPADAPLVRSLFREYADGLGIDLSFQRFEEELAELPGKYAPPDGGLWLAMDRDQVAGCVALRPLLAGTSEMKRLYVRPAFRGRGVGRMLAEHVLATAAEAGYRRICLDTLPFMNSAIELYRSLGFCEVEAYTHNPAPGAMWFAKELNRT